jgi:uncharacterized protein YqjF (DUF2071 family)
VSDFPDPNTLLAHTAHRPWPVPDRPWRMTQSWHDLLFAHWPLEPGALRGKVPASLPLDLFDGHAWIGVIPFRMTNVGARGMPSLPTVSAFPELNVRTYVTLNGKPGVFFLSLDAASTLAVIGARTMFHLPYYRAEMAVHAGTRRVTYRSVRRSPVSAQFAGTYEPVGSAAQAQPGTIEYFLTERYCLYTTTRSGEPRRLEIHHQPWPLHLADAQIAVNTMASAAGIALPKTAPLLHFAKRLDVLTWGLAPV